MYFNGTSHLHVYTLSYAVAIIQWLYKACQNKSGPHLDSSPDSTCPLHENSKTLTLEAPTTTAADDIHKHFIHCFSKKIRLHVSSKSSARQRIHMKKKALFSLKDKSKKLKCRLLQ